MRYNKMINKLYSHIDFVEKYSYLQEEIVKITDTS